MTKQIKGIRVPPDLEMVAVGALIRDPRNARTHSPSQTSEIASSIKTYGFNDPIGVDPENLIIEGHGRLMAAEKLGMTHVPVIRLPHMTEPERRAYALAHNRIAEHAGWDDALLAEELMALRNEFGMDIATMGFLAPDVAAILDAARLGSGAAEGAHEDEPTLPVKDPVSRLGDVWLLGSHRLICGDATAANTVERVLAGQRPVLMVTDPPYGVSYEPNWRNEADRASGKKIGARNVGRVQNDHQVDWREAWALFPGNVAYVWHASLFVREILDSLEASGFGARSQIVWVKNRMAISRGHYHWRHESCLYAVKKGEKANWVVGRKQSTVWRIEGLPEQYDAKLIIEHLEAVGAEQSVWEIPVTVDDGATGHSTQKPVECMRRPILNNSLPGELVYEPFCGSGSTLIAAQATGRKCFAVELDPRYVDAAVMRWQRYMGQSAVLEDNAATFAEVIAERAETGAAA